MAVVAEPGYRDPIAKLDVGEQEQGGRVRRDPRSAVASCGRGVQVGGCEDCDDAYGKRLYCQREWCWRCGAHSSDAHKRRMARWLPKVQEFSTLGYWVIELPEDLRVLARDCDVLSRLGVAAMKVLKGFGYCRGLRRWHWFNDPVCPCGCWESVDGKRIGLKLREDERGWYCVGCGGRFSVEEVAVVFNPHLNVLVEGSYRQDLGEIKEELRRAWGRVLGVGEADWSRIIVNYSYTDKPGRMVHRVKYVTRATARCVEWDEEFVNMVNGFRNSQTWGRFAGVKKWELEDGEGLSMVVSLEQGCCPRCGGKIRWYGVVDASLVAGAEELGGGYLWLDSVSWDRVREKLGLRRGQG